MTNGLPLDYDVNDDHDYDGLDRLKQYRRGTLDGEKNGISANEVYQTYTLDTLWPTTYPLLLPWQNATSRTPERS